MLDFAWCPCYNIGGYVCLHHMCNPGMHRGCLLAVMMVAPVYLLTAGLSQQHDRPWRNVHLYHSALHCHLQCKQ